MAITLGRIVVLVDKDYEEMELHYPRYRLIEAGYKVDVAGPKQGEMYQGKHGYPCKSDVGIEQVSSKDYHGIIIPGGWAPDHLRRIEAALRLVQEFNAASKLIGFICHAGWVLASAKILQGVHCTSTSAIKDDLIHAGAKWIDQPVVVDRHFVSSRRPEDLPVFMKEILRFLA